MNVVGAAAKYVENEPYWKLTDDKGAVIEVSDGRMVEIVRAWLRRQGYRMTKDYNTGGTGPPGLAIVPLKEGEQA